MESILTTIKKLLLISEEDESFDEDVIFHINSAFGILQQIGYGPKEGFIIEDDSTKWSEYITEIPEEYNKMTISMIKQYVYMKVKSIFDPLSSSVASQSLKEMTLEYETRLRDWLEIVNSME